MTNAEASKPRLRGKQTRSKTTNDMQTILRPWELRPWPSRGDLKAKIHQAVGAALTAWEEFEHSLSILFARLIHVDIDNDLAARRAFGAVRTFEARMAMVEAAVKVRKHEIPERLLDERLKELIIDGRRFCARRNEISHGTVTHYLSQNHSELQALFLIRKPGEKLGYCLIPSGASTQHRDVLERAEYCYSKNELDYFTEQFVNLRVRSQKIWVHLLGIESIDN